MTGKKWKIGEIYKTRDGSDAIIYAIHPNQKYAVHGAMYEDGEWNTEVWQLNGRYSTKPKSSYDLMPHKPETHVGWINIYGKEAGQFYSTREDSDKSALSNRTACIRIEWHEGQYDD